MKISFTPKKKQKDSLEQAKIVSIDKISGRVGISLRNGLISSATYLYDINDLRVGASVLVGRVSNTYVIMSKVSNMPRAGVAYSLAAPFTPLSSGVYYSLNGVDWILFIDFDFILPSIDLTLTYLSLYRALIGDPSPSISNFEYIEPSSLLPFNDDFSFVDNSKWIFSYGNRLETISNTLVLKTGKGSEYITSIGQGVCNEEMDVSVKTTILNTRIHNSHINWAYNFPAKEASLLVSHTWESSSVRYIRWFNYKNPEDIQGIIYLTNDDNDVWFRIIMRV